jgi:D-tyrosyl-tRNA(Tyr) deacylase
MILLGVRSGDSEHEADFVAAKCAGLRIFEDDGGKMNRSIQEVGGRILLISQFTLYGDTRKGRRPSFVDAARPDESEPLYERVAAGLREHGIHVETGIFGAEMQVELVNSGPVTLLVEREAQDR